MRIKLLLIVMDLMMFSTLSISQTIQHPWWVVDRGGGKATVDTFILQSSIGPPAIQRMVHLDTGMVLESGFIPGLRTQLGTYTAHTYDILEGWNLMSIPLIVDDFRKSSIFPTSVSSAFTYEGSYKTKDTLFNGSGFWLKYSTAEMPSIMGTSFVIDTIDVMAGWNIIGCLSYPMLIADVSPISPVTITSNFFGYNGGYFAEDTLKPGIGYWIKTPSAGQIELKINTPLMNNYFMADTKTKRNPSASIFSKFAEKHGLEELSFTDAEGQVAKLYFKSKSTDVDLDKFDLPPTPPSGIFDVRFASDRIAAFADQKKSNEIQSFRIKINGGKDPFTLSWNLEDGECKYSLQIGSTDLKTKTNQLTGYGQMKLSTSEIVSLRLIMDGSKPTELPKEFALHQNYPNPFNPTTKIDYDLPEDSKVTIKIFNMIGQEITSLVDETQDAGFKSVEWNASNYPSSVYIYKLTVQSEDKSFVDVKKLVLVK